MSPRRPLLSLEEKLAAEDRLLASLPVPRRWRAIALAAGVAIAAHATILALPGRGDAAAGGTKRPAMRLLAIWRAIPEPAIALRRTAPQKPPPQALAPSASEAGDDVLTEPVPEPPPPEVPLLALPIEAATFIGDPAEPTGPDEPEPVAPPVMRLARLIPSSRVEPVMPIGARALRASGEVILAVTVGADGAVAAADVLSCSRPGIGFERAAVDVVLRWRYEPAMRDGRPVPATVTVKVEFTW